MFTLNIWFGGGYSYITHKDGSITVGAIDSTVARNYYPQYPDHPMPVTVVTGHVNPASAPAFNAGTTPAFTGRTGRIEPAGPGFTGAAGSAAVGASWKGILNLSTEHGVAADANWPTILVSQIRLCGGTLSSAPDPDFGSDLPVKLYRGKTLVRQDHVRPFTLYELKVPGDWVDFFDGSNRLSIHPVGNPGVVSITIVPVGDPTVALPAPLPDFDVQYALIPTVPKDQRIWLLAQDPAPGPHPHWHTLAVGLFGSPPNPGAHCPPGKFVAP